jgi:poly(3-hydroxybutyrate) depolymerase
VQVLRLATALVLLLPGPAAAENKVEKLTFTSGETKGSYYLFVPEKAGAGPAPLLLLLHGSGGDGRSMIDPWKPLAQTEGIVLVAPDASYPQAWRIPQEGPDFFHDLLEGLRASHQEIDGRRMYVFGHSAGAIHGLQLAVLESEYFAAAAVHAGVMPPAAVPMLAHVPRKIPIAIWIGTKDITFSLDAVRETRDVLKTHGFDVSLTEVPDHGHDYYGSAVSINTEVWAFLRRNTLGAPPKYQEYRSTK